MSAVIDSLRALSSAEEFFEYLDVDYDPSVLRVSRLHILRRMGEMLARDELFDLDDELARTRCRSHLERAYAELVVRGPLGTRVFKVLREHAQPTRGPSKRTLIPLASLRAEED